MKESKSIEELLEIVEKNSKEEVHNNFAEDKTHFPKFIAEFSIKPGKTKYPTFIIYYYYKKMFKPSSRYKMSKIDFFRKFSKVYVQKRTNKQRYYLLDSTMEINDDIIREAITYGNRSKGTKKAAKEREKQKRKAKISRVRESNNSEESS